MPEKTPEEILEMVEKAFKTRELIFTGSVSMDQRSCDGPSLLVTEGIIKALQWSAGLREKLVPYPEGSGIRKGLEVVVPPRE